MLDDDNADDNADDNVRWNFYDKYLAGGQWAVKITMGLVLVALHWTNTEKILFLLPR
jgi:hypothetical protein